MRVITLDEALLRQHCKVLQEQIEAVYHPDLIIGIATGGVKVAEYMFGDVPHITVTCRRPSTKTKENAEGVMCIVRCLPVSVRNFMRMVEAFIMRIRKKEQVLSVEFLEEAMPEAKRVLVVDDAVDSGRTLKSVLEALNGGPEVRSATITITTSSPYVAPDYYLYNDKTLIRFPWSKDYRHEE